MGEGHGSRPLRPAPVAGYTPAGGHLGRETFDAGLDELARSPSFVEHNRRVHGTDLRFGMVDAVERARVVEAAGLGPGDRFVDLGCGWGTLTASIAAETGAAGLGVDIAESAINRASSRYAARDDLAFRVGDLDALALPTAAFRAAIAADSLYFCADLAATLRAVREALTPDGRLVVAWSSRLPGDFADSRLGEALRESGYDVVVHDMSASGKAFWARSVASCLALEAEWRAEDPARFEALLGEARRSLADLESGGNRWLAAASPSLEG